MPLSITWFGHNCWSIKSGDVTLLLDPFLDDSPVAPVRSNAVSADYILVSHGHFDHVGDAAKIAKRTGATVIAPFEICQWLGKAGAEKCEPMNLGGSINLPFGRVKMTIAQHGSVLPDGSPGGAASGFLLSLDDLVLYFACDTALFAEMAQYGKRIDGGRVDLAVLPIGDRFTMGPEDSIDAIKMIRPKRVVPAHYNTWPAIAQDAQAWASRVCKETDAEATVLEVGGSLNL